MIRAGFAAIVLAAGEGTRLKSKYPKVLHEVAGAPMIRHVLDAVCPLEPAHTLVVVGRDMEALTHVVAPAGAAMQFPPRGTGDAVRVALSALAARLDEVADVLVLFGDTPLLRSETVAALL